MTNYVFAYRGGADMATGSPEQQEQAMADWTAWFGTLGSALVEIGNPFARSSTVHADGSTTDGGESALTGFSVVTATDISGASALAKGCPLLREGGTVEVYEAIAM